MHSAAQPILLLEIILLQCSQITDGADTDYADSVDSLVDSVASAGHPCWTSIAIVVN